MAQELVAGPANAKFDQEPRRQVFSQTMTILMWVCRSLCSLWLNSVSCTLFLARGDENFLDGIHDHVGLFQLDVVSGSGHDDLPPLR